MIGKAIAGEAKATFFYISASSLTSKWVCIFSVCFGSVMVHWHMFSDFFLVFPGLSKNID